MCCWGVLQKCWICSVRIQFGCFAVTLEVSSSTPTYMGMVSSEYSVCELEHGKILLSSQSSKKGNPKRKRKKKTYISAEPLSKFRSRVCPPILTGETNSTSPSTEVASTVPVWSESTTSSFATFTEVVGLVSKGWKSLASTPLRVVASIPNLRYAFRSAAGPWATTWPLRLTLSTLKDRP